MNAASIANITHRSDQPEDQRTPQAAAKIDHPWRYRLKRTISTSIMISIHNPNANRCSDQYQEKSHRPNSRYMMASDTLQLQTVVQSHHTLSTISCGRDRITRAPHLIS